MGVVDNEGCFAYVGHNGCMEVCTFFSNLLWTWNGSKKNQVFENKIVVAERSGNVSHVRRCPYVCPRK